MIEQINLEVLSTAVKNTEIQINYRIINNSDEKIYLLSRLLYYPAGGGIQLCDPKDTIRLEEESGVLTIIKGYSPVDELVSFELYPAIVEVKPKKDFDGAIHLKLPLSSWHPNLGAAKLKSEIKQLNLKIAILPSFCTFNEITSNKNELLLQPIPGEVTLYQQWVSKRITI